MTKLALTHRDLGLSADCQEQNLKVWHCRTWVLPCQDAEAKMRSDSLKVTQIVIEQEPRLPVSKSPVFSGTK